jgi:hypothetical protein
MFEVSFIIAGQENSSNKLGTRFRTEKFPWDVNVERYCRQVDSRQNILMIIYLFVFAPSTITFKVR